MKPELRIPFATFDRVSDTVRKFQALFARVDPVMDEAEEPRELEAALKLLTKGQRALWTVIALEIEVGMGGFDQYFADWAGGTAPEALEGFRLLGLTRCADIVDRAIKVFPGGVVPRDRDERLEALGEDIPEDFDDLDDEFEAAIERNVSIPDACMKYVAAHPADFFLDAA